MGRFLIFFLFTGGRTWRCAHQKFDDCFSCHWHFLKSRIASSAPGLVAG